MSKRLSKLKNIQEANERLNQHKNHGYKKPLNEGIFGVATNQDRIELLKYARKQLNLAIDYIEDAFSNSELKEDVKNDLIIKLKSLIDTEDWNPDEKGINQYIDILNNTKEDDFDWREEPIEDDDDLPGFEGTNDSLNDLRIR
jgi:hypothetical protein